MRALCLLVTCLALSPLAMPAAAQQSANDPCSAGISCDCENIKDAGLLTRSWRADCRQCEGRIVDECRARYAKAADPLRAITEAVEKAGYCDPHCSVRGPNPRPLQEAKRPRRAPSDPPLPDWAKPMELLCGQQQKLHIDTMAGMQSSGCVNRDGKRHGLWIIRDTKRGLIIEVQYENGRQVSRRERKA